MIPGFLKKLVGFGGEKEGLSKAITDSAVPTEDALPNLSIAPKPTEAAPFPSTYANPMDSMPKVDAPAPVVPSFVQDPRMAGRSIADEFKMRQSDPNTNIVYREPFGAEKYNYVTNNNTELPHRSWKEALKNIATGAMAGAATHPENPLGGLIGGAAAGGVSGLVSPTAGKSMRFNMLQMPQLLQNRQMAQEQALYGAKIDAEQQKANQERATAQNKRYVRTANGTLDAQTGQIVQGTAPNDLGIHVIPAQGVAVDRNGKPVFSNTQARPVTPPAPHWVQNENGEYVDLNKAQGPVRGYQKQSDTDLTPLQKANQERQERQDAAKMAAQVEEAKTDANKAWKSGDKDAYETALGQHKALAETLRNTYPDYYDVKIGPEGWAEIKSTGAGRRNVKGLPVRGGTNGGGQRGRTIPATTAMDLLNR